MVARKSLIPDFNDDFFSSQYNQLTAFVYPDTVVGRVKNWKFSMHRSVIPDLERFQFFEAPISWKNSGHYPFGKKLIVQKMTLDLRDRICNVFHSPNPFEMLALSLACDIVFPDQTTESELRKIAKWFNRNLLNKYRRYGKRGDKSIEDTFYFNFSKNAELAIYTDKECRLHEFSKCIHLEWRIHGITNIRRNKLPISLKWLCGQFKEGNFVDGLSQDCIDFVQRKLTFLKCDLDGLMKEIRTRYGKEKHYEIFCKIFDLKSKEYIFNSGRIRSIINHSFHGKTRWADQYFKKVHLNIEVLPNLDFGDDPIESHEDTTEYEF